MEKYYYLTPNNSRVGPLSLKQLSGEGISVQTYVWKRGLPKWTIAARIPETAKFFTPEEIASANTPHPSTLTDSAQHADPGCPPDYLVWAIVSTVIFCVPFGIVAVIKSVLVKRYYGQARYTAALKLSSAARIWCIVSVVTSLVIWFVYFICKFIGFGFIF